MTQPDWCPQRVWYEAVKCNAQPTDERRSAIARAIMAAEKRGEEREREACAQVADEEERKRLANMRSAQDGSAQWGDPQAAAIAQGHKAVTAMSIAAAIRNRKDIP